MRSSQRKNPHSLVLLSPSRCTNRHHRTSRRHLPPTSSNIHCPRTVFLSSWQVAGQHAPASSRAVRHFFYENLAVDQPSPATDRLPLDSMSTPSVHRYSPTCEPPPMTTCLRDHQLFRSAQAHHHGAPRLVSPRPCCHIKLDPRASLMVADPFPNVARCR